MRRMRTRFPTCLSVGSAPSLGIVFSSPPAVLLGSYTVSPGTGKGTIGRWAVVASLHPYDWSTLSKAQFLDQDRFALWHTERTDDRARNESEEIADLEISSRRLAQKLGAIVIGPRQHVAAQPLLGGFDSKLPRPLDETTNDCVTPDDFVCVSGALFCRRLYKGCLRRDRLAAAYECSIYRYREGDQRGAVLCV
jgi:hypothetical protein